MFFEFAIIGTTASGKTALAMEIAQEFDAIILSLDSLCIYKQINIASAKPSQGELERVRHFGINLADVDCEFCVGDFINEYQKAKEFAKNSNKPLIITGGSGFYLSAMLKGLSPKIKPSNLKLTNEEIWQMILKFDTEFANKFSQNDTFRLNKWLDIWEQTKEVPSRFLAQNTLEATIKNLEIFEILWDKDELFERIKKRTNLMLETGLLNEASELFNKFDKDLKPLKSIGLKECKEFFDNKIDKNELINLINIHTRQLAKRQRTFYKSQFGAKFSDNFTNTKEQVLKFMQNFKNLAK